jgi:hypothetical protein
VRLRLLGSRTALLPLAIPLTGLLLHRDHLWILPQLPVKDGQLLVELAPGFYELIESCPLLGVGGAMTRHWLWVGTARGRCHTNVALVRGVTRPRGQCFPGHRNAGGGIGRAQVVDVCRHRVVWEARLSTGIHGGVPLHKHPPSERLGSACLEGEVVEVVGGEPKCSCVGFGPNMAMIVSSEKPQTVNTKIW